MNESVCQRSPSVGAFIFRGCRSRKGSHLAPGVLVLDRKVRFSRVNSCIKRNESAPKKEERRNKACSQHKRKKNQQINIQNNILIHRKYRAIPYHGRHVLSRDGRDYAGCGFRRRTRRRARPRRRSLGIFISDNDSAGLRSLPVRRLAPEEGPQGPSHPRLRLPSRARPSEA